MTKSYCENCESTQELTAEHVEISNETRKPVQIGICKKCLGRVPIGSRKPKAKKESTSPQKDEPTALKKTVAKVANKIPSKKRK
ncbi:MAG: hypothetical protein ACR2LL_08735 [Nitrosopumilus sp.]